MKPRVIAVVVCGAALLPGAQEAPWQNLRAAAAASATSNCLAEAAALYERAAQQAETGLAGGEAVADCLAAAAAVYRAMGNYTQALLVYRQSLAARETAYGAGDPELATSINNLGMYAMRAAAYTEAELQFLRALTLHEHAGSTASLSYATVLNNLGTLYGRMGRYAEAEPLLVRALALRAASLGAYHPATTEARNNLAALLHVQRKYELAEPLFAAALDAVRSSGHSDPRMTATALNNLGAVSFHLGKYDSAIRYHTQALTMRESIHGTNHPDVAQSLDNLGRAQMMAGQWPQAETALHAALAMRIALCGELHPDTARSLRNLGRLAYMRGQYADAAVYYEQALHTRLQCHGDAHPDVAESYADVAELAATRGDHAAAIQQYFTALMTLEAARARGGGELYAEGVRLDQRTVCDGMVRSLAALPPAQAATLTTNVFIATEVARERELVDQISVAAAARAAGLPADDAAREVTLRMHVRDAEQALARALRTPLAERDDQTLADCIAAARAARLAYAALLDELRATHPRFAALYGPPVFDFTTLASVLQPGEAVISFWESDDQVSAWVVTGGACMFVPLTYDMGEYSRLVTQLRAILEYALPDPAAYQRAAGRLYALLLAPCLERLGTPPAQLYIAASGLAAQIPFEALTVLARNAGFDGLDYVQSHLAIAYVPSLTALQLIRSNARAREQIRAARNPILLIGDPWYGTAGTNDGSHVRGAAPVRPRRTNDGALALPPLPGTRREVNRIAAVFDRPADTALLLGHDARESTLKRMSAAGSLRTFRYIHLAAHGLVPDAYRLVSEPCLALAHGDAPDDGLLSVTEILALQLDADLVTLSSCRSGVMGASAYAQRGIATLAHAFFLAGATHLMVSHWNVDDSAAAEFMAEFYRTLQRSHTPHPARAIQTTRQHLLRHSRYAHPFYWAAFALHGAPADASIETRDARVCLRGRHTTNGTQKPSTQRTLSSDILHRALVIARRWHERALLNEQWFSAASPHTSTRLSRPLRPQCVQETEKGASILVEGTSVPVKPHNK